MEIIIEILARFFPVLTAAAFVAIIVYLIYQRIEEKKHETFEDRDN